MRILWIVLLVEFAALTVYAVAVGDWAELVEYLATLGPWGILATCDLLIALTIAIAFLWRDARGKGVNPVPYLVLTVLTGSLGVLVYLVRYWDRELPEPTPTVNRQRITS